MASVESIRPATESALARFDATVLRRTVCAAIAEPAIWEMSLKLMNYSCWADSCSVIVVLPAF